MTREEAGALIGQRVRSLRAFRGVPKGTTGKVIRAYPTGNGDTYSVDVEWDLPPHQYIQHGDGTITRKSDGALVVRMAGDGMIYGENVALIRPVNEYRLWFLNHFGFETTEMLLGSPEHLEQLRNRGMSGFGSSYPGIPTGPGNPLKGGTIGRVAGHIRLPFIRLDDDPGDHERRQLMLTTAEARR